MTLVETLVALALLGIGILMAGSVVLWASRVEERAGRRVAAMEMAGNVAERLRAAPYGAVRSGELDLTADVPPASLEDPVVTLEVGEDEELGLKKVIIVVTWAGEAPGKFVLVTAVGRGELYR
jgi:type II secretory pathway pseudopilin PulG